MPLRWQEVAVPLCVVLILVLLKYVPAMADLPLARLAGIVSFGYAIFLSLRLIQSEEAVTIDGWSELRASPVEMFGAFGGAVFSAIMLVSVIFIGPSSGASTMQMAAAFLMSLALAGVSGAIIYTSIMVRVRWNRSSVERQDARGRKVSIDWNEVTSVEGRWRGITISTADRRVLSFSPLQSGAAQLAKFASDRARRNTSTAAKAFWA